MTLTLKCPRPACGSAVFESVNALVEHLVALHGLRRPVAEAEGDLLSHRTGFQEITMGKLIHKGAKIVTRDEQGRIMRADDYDYVGDEELTAERVGGLAFTAAYQILSFGAQRTKTPGVLSVSVGPFDAQLVPLVTQAVKEILNTSALYKHLRHTSHWSRLDWWITSSSSTLNAVASPTRPLPADAPARRVGFLAS